MNEVQQLIETWLRDILTDVAIKVCKETIPVILEEYFTGYDPVNKMYTKDEVCKILDICPATYHNWINSGKLTEVKIRGRVYVDPKVLRQVVSDRNICLEESRESDNGNPKPSESDIKGTEKLKEAADTMDIRLLDHIIIAGDSYYSFPNRNSEQIYK